MEYAIDYINSDGVEVTVDDRGIAHVDAIILREGPMRYIRPGIGVRWEHVDQEALESAVDTAGGAPVTEGHPPDFLNPEIIEDHVAGVADMSAEIVDLDNGRSAVMHHMMIHDQKLIEKIEEGKTQISTGRTFEAVDNPGEFEGIEYDIVQRDLQINHIAIVDSGRCGDDCSIITDEDVITDQPELPEDVAECAKSIKDNPEIDESEAIAICRAQDRGEWQDRLMALMDADERDNSEIVEAIAGMSQHDRNDVESIISGTMEPKIGVVHTIGRILGIEQDTIEQWAIEKFGDKALDIDSNSVIIKDSGKKKNHKGGKRMQFDLGEKAFDVDIGDCEKCESIIERVVRTANDQLHEARKQFPASDQPSLENVLTFLAEVLEVPVDDVASALAPLSDEIESEENEEMEEPDDDTSDGEHDDNEAMNLDLINTVASVKAVDSEFAFDGESRKELVEHALDSLDVDYDDEKPADYLQAVLDQALDAEQNGQKTRPRTNEEEAQDEIQNYKSKWYNIGSEK